MKLVLVSCCAPCSAGAIKQLADGCIPDVDDFVVMFFNPNIFPESEYQKRMREQIRYCEKMGVKHVELEYNHDAWRAAVRGMEAAPERGARCTACFEFRFARAFAWARENGYDAVASVLGVSRHKDQGQVDRAAASKCTGGVRYVPVKWDERLRVEIGRASDFYRQNYCGCEFSIRKATALIPDGIQTA